MWGSFEGMAGCFWEDGKRRHYGRMQSSACLAPRVGAEVRINYFHRLTYRADSVVVGKSSRTERRVGSECSGSKIKTCANFKNSWPGREVQVIPAGSNWLL